MEQEQKGQEEKEMEEQKNSWRWCCILQFSRFSISFLFFSLPFRMGSDIHWAGFGLGWGWVGGLGEGEHAVIGHHGLWATCGIHTQIHTGTLLTDRFRFVSVRLVLFRRFAV